MTFDEILAHNRNLKRRRIKYRTTKEPPLSHTEEVRKLISVQMDALQQYFRNSNLVQTQGGEIVWNKNENNLRATAGNFKLNEEKFHNDLGSLSRGHSKLKRKRS